MVGSQARGRASHRNGIAGYLGFLENTRLRLVIVYIPHFRKGLFSNNINIIFSIRSWHRIKNKIYKNEINK